MSKKKRIILITIVLLVWLWFAFYYLFFDGDFNCKMKYKSCLEQQKQWVNIACIPCNSDFYNY